MDQLEDFISIKSNENIEGIVEISEAYLFKKYNIKNSLICKNNTMSIKKDTFDLISKHLAQNILLKYSVIVLYNFFEEDYGELSQDEKFDIKTFLRGKIKSSEFVYYTDIFDKKLHYFTNQYNRINIDGFIEFGINDIKDDLHNLLERYANEFLIEEELSEFSYMLKSYIDTESSLIDEINVVIDKSGRYNYFDKEKNDITKICLNEFYNEFYDSDASDDEMLITILIINLPKKIIVHRLPDCRNTNLLMMLKNIFGNRLTFCLEKCEFCKS